MLHGKRRWQVKTVTPEELLEHLIDHTWCGCQGFRCCGMLWLNDATSADGAQEYGVIRESDGAQVESVTVSWCTKENLKEYLDQYIEALPEMRGLFSWKLKEGSLDHQKECSLCA